MDAHTPVVKQDLALLPYINTEGLLLCGFQLELNKHKIRKKRT